VQPVLAQYRGYDWGPGMMFWGPGLGWFWGVIAFAFWFALMVLLFLAIRYLALLIRDKGRPVRTEESPLEMLKKRYARGDIGRDEFEEKKRDLET
jgi:putative membrane protein